MYGVKNSNRVLLKDGRSILNNDDYIRLVLSGAETSTAYTIQSVDTDLYEKRYNTVISVTDDVEELPVEPNNHKHTENDMTKLLDIISNSDRMCDVEESLERLDFELEYFERTNNILFLLRAWELIEEFRRDNVVWGVGRGSACASYVLYLLHVHDVNPLEFDIPFYEMSKEF